MKKLYSLTIAAFVLMGILVSPQDAYAQTAGISAVLITPADVLKKADDSRAQTLRGFLENRNSPLAPYAKTFVDEADKNNLDWRLVAAISGLESSFGVHIPAYSNNGWGFGIYGNNVKSFSSWEEGIVVVSSAIRNDYMEKWGATNVYEIGKFYAASQTWAERVQYFMNAIDEYEKTQERTALTLSL